MSKYYNKELPVAVHAIYGERRYGVTYREIEKLRKENEELKKAWEDANKSWERQVNKVGKAIRYLESYHNTVLGECDKEILLKILKGSEE